MLCDYCQENEAVHQFGNGKWCCSSVVHRCPGYKRKWKDSIEKSGLYADSKRQKLLKEIKEKKHKCKYCDRKARFLLSQYNFCCQPKARLCPGYKDFVRAYMIKKYENEELRNQMSESMFEVHNRPDVIEKKRRAMYELHNGSSEESRIFQENYKSGRIKFKETLKRR